MQLHQTRQIRATHKLLPMVIRKVPTTIQQRRIKIITELQVQILHVTKQLRNKLYPQEAMENVKGKDSWGMRQIVKNSIGAKAMEKDSCGMSLHVLMELYGMMIL